MICANVAFRPDLLTVGVGVAKMIAQGAHTADLFTHLVYRAAHCHLDEQTGVAHSQSS